MYRQVHSRYFTGIDKYYTPFFSPTITNRYPPAELKQISLANGKNLNQIPQLLTNSAENFIWAARELEALSYNEINLNLGCPSGTVVAKKKGSGFLALPDELDRFLDDIFTALPQLHISVKTRLGLNDAGEFARLLDIYNQYPIYELTVHPRVRTDYYKKPVNLTAFEYALRESKNPVVYNGNIFTAEDYRSFTAAYPQTGAVMLGRGLAANPGLADRLITGNATKRETLREFHAALCEGYQEILYGDVALTHRLKELWSYMIKLFADNEKHYKRLCKARGYAEYSLAADSIFNELELLSDADGVC